MSTTLNLALEKAGLDVKLLGKMDTGGAPTMLPQGTSAAGYHGSGSWDAPSRPVESYFPGDILHSWARGANISKAAFAPLMEPGNSWVRRESPSGSYSGRQDWHTVEECVQFLERYKEEDGPFFLYCSVVSPHPPYWSNSSWYKFVNETALNYSIATMPYPNQSSLHPADRYSSLSEGADVPRGDPLIYDLNWVNEGIDRGFHV